MLYAPLSLLIKLDVCIFMRVSISLANLSPRLTFSFCYLYFCIYFSQILSFVGSEREKWEGHGGRDAVEDDNQKRWSGSEHFNHFEVECSSWESNEQWVTVNERLQIKVPAYFSIYLSLTHILGVPCKMINIERIRMKWLRFFFYFACMSHTHGGSRHRSQHCNVVTRITYTIRV